MYNEKQIAVVVPMHNEATQIAAVLTNFPEWLDAIFVVDDASTDDSAAIVQALAADDARIELISLAQNSGVGAARQAGYERAMQTDAEIIVGMDGDGQMDAAELPRLLDPIIKGGADYTKGNRFLLGDVWNTIPRTRLFGNAILSFLTKIASGYWHISDSQNGYTAITRQALSELLAQGIYPRYGFPNDVLVKLNVHNFVVRDVPMRPIYGVGETSKLKIPRVVLPIALLLMGRFFYRLWHKYVVRDTHPLVLFYLLGLFLTPLGILYGGVILSVRLIMPHIDCLVDIGLALRPFCTMTGTVLDALVTLIGMQMLLFAMWFDMQDNARLR